MAEDFDQSAFINANETARSLSTRTLLRMTPITPHAQGLRNKSLRQPRRKTVPSSVTVQSSPLLQLEW